MKILKGKIPSASKVVIYGVEGIGKSTLAAQFPAPLIIDVEGSTTTMDVHRTERPRSWEALLGLVRAFAENPAPYKTLVIDTADWAERLCTEKVCASMRVDGIEAIPYGKGWVFVAEEFGRLLNGLSGLAERGFNIVITAHAMIRKFELPDEAGAYDRWELKLGKKTAPLLKEWADMVLFCNYKTIVVDNNGTKKAQGGQRVMYTAHAPAWDAKNRHGLPEMLPLGYAGIRQAIEGQMTFPAAPSVAVSRVPEPPMEEIPLPPEEPISAPLAQLRQLMAESGVSEGDLQRVVAQRGYFPGDIPIKEYPEDFLSGVLVAAWEQVIAMVRQVPADTGV